jgi:hypothetical protein
MNEKSRANNFAHMASPQKSIALKKAKGGKGPLIKLAKNLEHVRGNSRRTWERATENYEPEPGLK